jgi:hypothetical protein
MVLSVLDDYDVLAAAAALQGACDDNRRLKRLLRAAEELAGAGGARDLLRLIRLKVTQLEDQTDGVP